MAHSGRKPKGRFGPDSGRLVLLGNSRVLTQTGHFEPRPAQRCSHLEYRCVLAKRHQRLQRFCRRSQGFPDLRVIEQPLPAQSYEPHLAIDLLQESSMR